MAERPAEGPGSDWADTIRTLQAMWSEANSSAPDQGVADQAHYSDPANWVAAVQALLRLLPRSPPETQKRLWEEGLALFETVLGQYGIGPKAGDAGENGPQLPRQDRRFADPAWRESPLFALLHQAYLMLGEEALEKVASLEMPEPATRDQALFAAQAMLDALSPANFPLTNPVALDRAAQTGGQSLVKGMGHWLADMKRGQLTHSDPSTLTLGETIATTPGKVIHQTPLYQLIQYTPVTNKVLKIPLVIFPAWINRFYILDLNEKKSFVRWALEQGISVFMVSWKSADESMAEITWDDYIAAQIEVIDQVCERLKVPSAHVVGYCVAGTTLAATLAVLARRGDAEKVNSATFLTAQVDFEEPGDLGHFVDDRQIQAIDQLGARGYVDGRYLAATFNLLRGKDLIWDYFEKHYLLGEDYRAFDLLHWNGDTTNLPVKFLQQYLRDLYRDNRMIQADSLSACGEPVDLRRIATPSYIHAAREDHIAPAQSVWKLMRHLECHRTFLLAASGHIAGVVNPPAAGKYRYWTNDGPAETLEEFIEGASEHRGSWWPHWADWLRSQDDAKIDARGNRKPGGRGDKVVEDAPGIYVKSR
ncbi:MAG: alpha/beta fold hydrolase [Novosphingobium sp.]|nr:alpha/beta fold hydrolase [Novosphingobium sp.]